MKVSYFILLAIAIFIVSCSSWKNTLASKGDTNVAIGNAIIDFMHTSNLRKKDSIFSVDVYRNDQDGMVIRIGDASINKLYPGCNPVKKIGTYSRSYPSRYVVYDKKLFYWEDSTIQITQEVVDVLNRYNHVDTMSFDTLEVFFPYIIREYAKGAHYYYCKNDLRIYKKVETRIGYGGYTPPKLNCNKCKR